MKVGMPVKGACYLLTGTLEKSGHIFSEQNIFNVLKKMNRNFSFTDR